MLNIWLIIRAMTPPSPRHTPISQFFNIYLYVTDNFMEDCENWKKYGKMQVYYTVLEKKHYL